MRRWYNNSIQEIFHDEDKPIPEGFILGRLPFSKTCIENMSKSQKGRKAWNKGIPRTKEAKEKTSKTLLEGYASGRIKHTEQIPWNKGLKGVQSAWNKGISYYSMHSIEDKDRMVEKIKETKDKNHSWNTSKSEENFYNFLRTIFSEEDIYRQYSEERYPFKCDFYIKSKDLFIELNLHPSHFTHPFDKNNEDDVNYLNYLKSSYDKWDKMILGVWGDRDMKKVEFASSNKLNYYTCYSDDEVQRLSKLLLEEKNL